MLDTGSGYIDKLRSDMLEQFKGQPNSEVFMAALARQLEKVHGFFSQLAELRWLQSAEGVQLDGIGDIVALSRLEAYAVSRLASQGVPMDDATYRRYLAWKIALNTTNCTHRDVYNALKMFWDKPLYYSEDPAHPATAFYSTGVLAPEDNAWVLFVAPRVKAAGVALFITAITETPMGEPHRLWVTGIAHNAVTETRLPPFRPDEGHGAALAAVAHLHGLASETALPPMT